MKNHYATLGLKFGASDEDIKRNYRALAKKYHPDINANDPGAAAKFAALNEANDVLSDPARRKAYDAEFAEIARRAARIRAAEREQTAARQSQNAARPAYSQSDAVIAKMQMEARINEQVAAQVQAQLIGVRERAFADGYEKGKLYGKEVYKQKYGKEAAESKQQASEYARDRSELEEELFERDRELGKANGRIKELEMQLGWFRRAAGGGDQVAEMFADRLGENASRAKELAAEIDKLAATHINATSDPMLRLDKQKRMKTDIGEVDARIAALTQELAQWKAEIRRRDMAAKADTDVAAAEATARRWAAKQKADIEKSKNTLYAPLGLLIWCSDEEIRTAYANMCEHYSQKDDVASASKLVKVKEAYSVLSDRTKRREYNRSIGYDDAKLESERKLIRENELAQIEYRSKLAAKAFWVHFDELTALALSGDADAQNALGEIYYTGNTAERDYVQAAYWFREAVKEKHPAAIYHLGICYLNGHGVNKNRSIGLAFLRQANNLGYKGNI